MGEDFNGGGGLQSLALIIFTVVVISLLLSR